jgi:hypothetical protein
MQIFHISDFTTNQFLALLLLQRQPQNVVVSFERLCPGNRARIKRRKAGFITLAAGKGGGKSAYYNDTPPSEEGRMRRITRRPVAARHVASQAGRQAVGLDGGRKKKQEIKGAAS